MDDDDCYLDEECAAKLNTLLKTFGFYAEVIVCDPVRHPSPGFLFCYSIPAPPRGIIYDGDTFFETREEVTDAVNKFIVQRHLRNIEA